MSGKLSSERQLLREQATAERRARRIRFRHEPHDEPYPDCPPGCGAEHHFHPWTQATREPGSVLCPQCRRRWVKPGMVCESCEYHRENEAIESDASLIRDDEIADTGWDTEVGPTEDT